MVSGLHLLLKFIVLYDYGACDLEFKQVLCFLSL